MDFEFNQTTEEHVNLVSCSTYVEKTGEKRKWWLHNRPDRQRELAKYLGQFECIIGYACVAEARSFLALLIDPLQFDWIDMFIEYRLMTNHNDKLQWGKQLVDGKIRFFKKPKPKWERSEEDKEGGFKATHSLAEATYKLCGVVRDTKEKKRMRDLIISNPKSFTKKERIQILNYNMEDVVFLPNIWKRLKEEFAELSPEIEFSDYVEEAILRGRYSAHTAIMESTGYPIDYEATKNFSKRIPLILMECQRDINSQFPDKKPFRWNPKPSRFSWNQAVTKAWIKENHDQARWVKTDGGDVSLSLEAFERFYPFKHSYPRDNFGAQMVRYLKLKQSLYGFSDAGGKRKNFWDSVGSDQRVRPYMNIFGAQSSRSQPAASGFMFLKPAWMRALVVPPPDSFMAGIDFGQQEFFLAALESGDQNMIDAYLSGDPYLYGAKLAGVIPWSGTIEEYKEVRGVFKNTYLGILYGMTKYGLAIKLTNDTGRTYTEDDAQEQISLFEENFVDYMHWKKELILDYQSGCAIRLPCGWTMWNDNENIRSVCNVPTQGLGGSVMRKSVDLAVDRKVKVLFTLHDAIYMEDKLGNEKRILDLKQSMIEGFQHYYRYDEEKFQLAGQIKLDPFMWSTKYKKDSELKIGNWKVPASNLYIDERSIDEYNKFSKYFGASDAIAV